MKPDGAADFDFLIGSWSVRHRRLERRLAQNTNWIEFSGPASARKILGGLGNIDEIVINLPAGPYVGATLRLFNPSTTLWSIYWMDSRNPGLDPPMTGQFSGNRGLFYGDDTFEGRAHSRALHLDRLISNGLSLGTGVLCRPRRLVGDELDNGIHSGERGLSGKTRRSFEGAATVAAARSGRFPSRDRQVFAHRRELAHRCGWR